MREDLPEGHQGASTSTEPCPAIGVVVIGRNEGERLVRCLASVASSSALRIYVDSGSIDGSVGAAASCGATVVQLDTGRPFTAARARNLGFQALREALPAIGLVQFVDGDCEVVEGWVEAAAQFLVAHPEVAVVCGRRRERHPEQSIYNRLCDMEWDTPVGEAKACGGDAMMRVEALRQVGGFRDDLIAGEEPELCVRLRQRGWHIWRLDREMTRHDAALLRFSQWWQRSRRAGFAFAEGAFLHGASPERHWVRESRSAQVWGLAIPLLTAAAVPVFGASAALALLVYPLQVARLAWRGAGSLGPRSVRALFLVLGKFPEALGGLTFQWQRRAGRRGALIEYK
jgi:GT2 family glycosyltransferase